MKLTSFVVLTSFFLLGITTQVQAAEDYSTTLLELQNHKYMMSAHLMQNESGDASGGGGRRFADNHRINTQDDSLFQRGSGR
ncbi:MAG: hypothetical protein AAFO04_12650 [Cyanobacteria bacterium J06592_8]